MQERTSKSAKAHIAFGTFLSVIGIVALCAGWVPLTADPVAATGLVWVGGILLALGLAWFIVAQVCIWWRQG